MNSPSTQKPGSAPGQTPGQQFVQERALFEYVERIGKDPSSKVAVHMHLSKLQQHRRREHYIRIAADTFENQVKSLGGQIFLLRNFDVIFVTDAKDLLAMEAAVNRQRLLFQEDPLTQFSDKSEQGGFSTWYRLDKEYAAFQAVCQGIYRAAEQSRSLLLQEQEIQEVARQLKPLQPEILAKLEQAIAKADLSGVIRSQHTCTILPDQPIQALFREYFVDITALQEHVTPGVELRANRWLFQYLTMALDSRMLSYVIREGIPRGEAAFSLNMNVGTVLSPQFQKFDEMIPVLTRGRLVIELQMVDVFADLGAFLFARDYLQERGYRVCLDGITHLTLRYVDRARLGADLMKLYWTPEGVNTIENNMLNHFKAHVLQTGQARTILCRCEDEFALEFGRAAGIIMFQGRHVERLYQRQRDPFNSGMGTTALPAPEKPPAAPDLRATR